MKPKCRADETQYTDVHRKGNMSKNTQFRLRQRVISITNGKEDMATMCKTQQLVLNQGHVAIYGLYQWLPSSHIAFILDLMNEEKYCQKGSSILQRPNKEETSRKKDFNKKLNCGLPRQIAISSFGFCISNNL